MSDTRPSPPAGTDYDTTSLNLVKAKAVLAAFDLTADDKVAAYLSQLLPSTRDQKSPAAALVPWACERLTSNFSRRAYFSDLARFLVYIRKHRIDPLAVTGDTLRIYRAALVGAGKSPATVGRVLSVLRGTYHQFAKKGLISWEQARDIQAVESPPVAKNTTPSLSEAEAIRLLHTPDCSTVIGLRDYALLFVYFKTACRLGAVANALIGHIERTDTDHYLVVWEKGRGAKKRQRKALLESAPAVLAYLDAADIRDDTEGPLFRPVAKDRKSLIRKSLSPRAVLAIVKKHARDAGIDVNRLGGRGVCTHSLRKSAINNALQHGARLEHVRMLAGHADIRTTQDYIVVSDRDAEDAARHIQIR